MSRGPPVEKRCSRTCLCRLILNITEGNIFFAIPWVTTRGIKMVVDRVVFNVQWPLTPPCPSFQHRGGHVEQGPLAGDGEEFGSQWVGTPAAASDANNLLLFIVFKCCFCVHADGESSEFHSIVRDVCLKPGQTDTLSVHYLPFFPGTKYCSVLLVCPQVRARALVGRVSTWTLPPSH